MYICEQCKTHINEGKPEAENSVPFFTVLGGIVGTLGTAFTGGLLLIPAGLIAGSAGDVLRHCGICNHDIKESEPCYHVMEAVDNDFHGQTGQRFRPFNKSQPNSNAQQQSSYAPLSQPSSRPLQPPNQLRQGSHAENQHRDNKSSQPQEFVFDQIERKLVPLDSPKSEPNDSGDDLANFVGTDPMAGGNTPLTSGLSGKLFLPEIDMSFDVMNDFSIIPEPFNGPDEPLQGEPLL